jgi:hypothetical protein
MIDIAYIRKLASLEQGRRYLEGPKVDAAAFIGLHKAASVADPELLKIASRLAGNTMQNYRQLGGTFTKAAFGIPMFGAQKPLTVKPPTAPKAPGSINPSSKVTAGGGASQTNEESGSGMNMTWGQSGTL